MEYLVLGIILYFILRTSGNLVRLMGGDDSSAQDDRAHASSSQRRGWEGPSPRQHTGAARDEPTFWGKDIEDATWHDLDGDARPSGQSP